MFIEARRFEDLVNLTELSKKVVLENAYSYDEANDRYILDDFLKEDETKELIETLEKQGFSSLNFTHSESEFQFYDLHNLWKDIRIGLENNLKTLNVAVEPIKAKEIAHKFFGMNFSNITREPPFKYNMKTKYAKLFGKEADYLYSREETLHLLMNFFSQVQ
jgi:hypothetical protein